MTTSNLMKSGVILVILLNIWITSPRTIQVPIVKHNKTLHIKIDQTYQMSYPNFKLDEVRQRYVSEKTANGNKPFHSCIVAPSEIQFIIQDYVHFDGVPEKPLLIYNFDDLKYSQFLLDFYIENNDIYVMFRDGTVAYINLVNEDRIGSKIIYRVTDLQNDEKLQIGYFTKINKAIIFINQKYAIRLERQRAFIMQNYKIEENLFQAVTSINDKYIVAAYSSTINVYVLDGYSKLKLVDWITSTSLNNQQNYSFVDLFYYDSQQTLLVLDAHNGLVGISVSMDSGTIDLQNNTQSLYNKQFCSMMSLNAVTQTLHILCDYVYEIDMNTWPNLKEININNIPNIRIQQIFCIGPLSIFIGRDAFTVRYWDKTVSYYEDENLDRLIFTQDSFISANQDSLTIGKYKLIDPYIRCKITDISQLGDHTLIFETLAECNDQYFNAYSVNKTLIGQYNQKDKCFYTTQQNIYVWMPGQVITLPVILTVVGFFVITIAIMICMVLNRIKLKKTTTQYDSFIHENQGVQSGQDINYSLDNNSFLKEEPAKQNGNLQSQQGRSSAKGNSSPSPPRQAVEGRSEDFEID